MKASKGKAAAVFKLRETIIGSKKVSSDPVMVIDSKSSVPVMSPSEIKSSTLDYCVGLLSKKRPKDEYQGNYEGKVHLHNQRMIEVFENDCHELSVEMFNEVLTQLAKKPGHKYDGILKGGQSLINALFHLYYAVWKTEKVPES